MWSGHLTNTYRLKAAQTLGQLWPLEIYILTTQLSHFPVWVTCDDLFIQLQPPNTCLALLDLPDIQDWIKGSVSLSCYFRTGVWPWYSWASECEVTSLVLLFLFFNATSFSGISMIGLLLDYYPCGLSICQVIPLVPAFNGPVIC